MLTSTVCFTPPLSFPSSASTWENLFVTHLHLIPSLSSNLTRVFVLFSVRGFLAECIHHSLLPALHTQKASDVCRNAEDQIKSTQLLGSAIRGLWPRHRWRHTCKPNNTGGDGSPLIPTDKLEWVRFTNRRTSSAELVLRHTRAFNGFIYSPRWALLCVLSVSVFVLPARLSFNTFPSLFPRTHLSMLL